MRSGSKRPSGWTRRRIEATTASASRLSDGLTSGRTSRVDALRFEDHDDRVFVVARESGRGHGSGASTDAMLYSVITFRDGKISRYREFYDEATARATLE